MSRPALFLTAAVALGSSPSWAHAQANPQGPSVDSIAVVGARRVQASVILLQTGLSVGEPLSFRDLQRAITNLYGTGNFDDVTIEQVTVDGRRVLRIRVRERPVLVRWSSRGTDRISERAVRNQVVLADGRPLDRAALERSRAAIDSLYRSAGFYQSRVEPILQWSEDSSTIRVVFAIDEGKRVPIAQIVVDDNTHLSDENIAGAMKTGTEGFWWFQRGEYDEEKLQANLYERLPSFYGKRGFVDFQVVSDTLVVDDATGKGTLRLTVREGEPHRVGAFEIVGNRRFSTQELEALYPFGPRARGLFGLGGTSATTVFDQSLWDEATQHLRNLYTNQGYIYAQIRPELIRRRDAQGQAVVDLRWVINEGQPATIRRVDIVGNTHTHERVIRDALLVIPGDVYNQDRLIRSFQNLVNLGFFEQTMPPPDVQPANDQGDVDIIFTVEERRTGNVQVGASLGQGTGLGGFIGLDEPNLFGRGKRGRIQWQFGRNINDIDLSYTDPAFRGSRMSATIRLHNTRLRYTIADLGRIQTRGVSLQLGFPIIDRYNRLFVSYALEQETYTGSPSNPAFQSRFRCLDCLRSAVGVSVLRDTRINLPFPTGGTMHQGGITFNGGPLGGTGDFRRVDLEGRWYTPLAELGGGTPGSQPAIFVLGFQTRTGFVFGDVGPFFRQLFALGGTQFGVPVRGYEEFAITPKGFDPFAQNRVASPDAFGASYLALTGEIGLRLSQMLYLNTFVDAANNWARASEFNPPRLFRGAGVGISLISPLGPLGLDFAYGFDRVGVNGEPDPGWKLHFKLGNFF